MTSPIEPGAFAAADEDADELVALAVRATAGLPLPGHGHTDRRWNFFSSVAAQNVTAARILEAHADAVAILAEAGEELPQGSWGVFAAEAPGMHLDAARTADGSWQLSGTKPWCSLAGRLDAALVTARVDGGRRLFAMDLRQNGVRVGPTEAWVARGLRAVPSGPVDFEKAAARPVGAPGWYLDRPGFAWGGMGVAACWYGGARGLLPALRAGAAGGDRLAALALGTADVALHAAATTLDAAAVAVDEGRAVAASGALRALRVRATVFTACETVLEQAAHALGPAPLAFDASHSARVADLGLYLRQHHAERELADLGERLVA